MSRQLVFDLSRGPCFDPDDFLVSPANEAAVSAVRAWPHWPHRMLLLIGPPGSGKSHLAALWASETNAIEAHKNEMELMSPWGGSGRPVLMEDCDRGVIAEAPFFHMLNLVRETNGSILMTARTSPSSWGLKTPDLLSRLRLASTATIHQPDAELMKAILIKLFADRQITIEEDVVQYAARHCDQSFEAVDRFVSAVDTAALAEGRRITRPLAAATLARLQASGRGRD